MLKKKLIKAAAAALVLTGRAVSPHVAMRMADRFARRFKLDPKLNKRQLRDNLRRYFPDRDEAWISATAVSLQANVARAKIFDKHFIPRLSEKELDDLVDVVGFEHIERAQREQRGIVSVSVHFGRYWCFPTWTSQHGILTTAFQASEGRLPGGDRILSGGSFNAGDPLSTLRAVKAIKKGAICFLILDAGKVANPVTIDFVGQPTLISTAAIRLARASGAYIQPVLVPIHPDDPNRVQVQLFEPIDAREVPSDEPIGTTMSRIVAPFEALIRSNPEQWYGLLNAHKRIARTGGDGE